MILSPVTLPDQKRDDVLRHLRHARHRGGKQRGATMTSAGTRHAAFVMPSVIENLSVFCGW
jgi:hypothetical protein